MIIDWEVIKQEYIESKGSVALKDLATQHGVKPATLRSRKNREKWDDEIHSSVAVNRALQRKKAATQRNATRKVQKALENISENNMLNDRQQLFCTYYVKYWNATKAYQKAYQGTYNTAMVEGSKHLRNPNILAEIENLKRLIRESILIEPMAVLQKYMDIAFADATDYADWGTVEIIEYDNNGKPLIDEDGKIVTRPVNYVRINDSDAVDGTIVTEISQGRDGIKIKLADRMKALEKLEQYFDLIPDEWKRKVEAKKLELEQEKLEVLKDKNNFGDDENEGTGVVFLPEPIEGEE